MIRNIYLILGVVLLVNQINGTDELQKNITKNSPICMEVAVGSTNPIKIQSVKNAFMNEDVNIVPCSALSNVRAQPLSDAETLQGAINRAKNCLEKTEAQLAFGLEAGVFFLNDQVYLCHWGAVVDRHQNTYFTNGPVILLPSAFQEALLAGQSLEDIMHHSTGIEKLGTKEGAIGTFTSGQMNREQVLTQMVKVLLGQYRYYQ